MHKEAREEFRVRIKLTVLEYASHLGVTKACKEFNVPRSSFCRWKEIHDREGQAGLYRKKPVAKCHPRKTPPEVVEKILEIRREYQHGALRIMYYLERYHGIKISESTVTRVLRAHGVGRLPKTAPRSALRTKRYAKKVTGHHVQIDVKLLSWLFVLRKMARLLQAHANLRSVEDAEEDSRYPLASAAARVS